MLVSGYNNIISLPNCTMLYYVFSGPLSLRAYVPEIKFNNTHVLSALHQSYVSYLTTARKYLGKGVVTPVMLLPSDLTVDVLLNPLRHTVLDWDKQALHLLCNGAHGGRCKTWIKFKSNQIFFSKFCLTIQKTA